MNKPDMEAVAACLVEIYKDPARDDALAEEAASKAGVPNATIAVPINLFIAVRGYVALTKAVILGRDTIPPDGVENALRGLAEAAQANVLAAEVIKRAQGNDHA